jgi:hypothetical protein
MFQKNIEENNNVDNYTLIKREIREISDEKKSQQITYFRTHFLSD